MKRDCRGSGCKAKKFSAIHHSNLFPFGGLNHDEEDIFRRNNHKDGKNFFRRLLSNASD